MGQIPKLTCWQMSRFWFLGPFCYRNSMRFAASVFLIASGAALIVSGFAYDLSFAGLPYQDPTPEMQDRWLFHKGMSGRIMLTGAIVLGIGCVWTAIPRIMRRLERRHSDWPALRCCRSEYIRPVASRAEICSCQRRGHLLD